MPKPNPVAALVRAFSQAFGAMADRVIASIDQQMKAGATPQDAVAFSFRVNNVQGRIQKEILDGMVTAVAIGYGISPALIANPLGLRATFLNSHWPGDSLTLSRRIASKEMQVVAASTISANLLASRAFQSRVATWQEMANDLAGFVPSGRQTILPGELSQAQGEVIRHARRVMGGEGGEAVNDLNRALTKARAQAERLGRNGAPNQSLKAAYHDIADKAQALTAKGLERAIRTAIAEKTRYNAERIARTEMARAYGTGVFTKAAEDVDVIGIKSSLSSRHPETDICDFHAHANLYGMGPGVFPKGKAPPYPYHPHCLCVLSEVYEGEAEVGEFQKDKGAKFLKGLPAGQKRLLLGAEGAKKIDGWENNLKGWQGHGAPQAYKIKVADLKPAEKASTQAEKVREIEAKIRPQHFESLAIISPSGEMLAFKDGTHNSVNVSDVRHLMKGNIVTHNHPAGWKSPENSPMRGGNSFSNADIRTAVANGAKEIRAASPLWDHIYRPAQGATTEGLLDAYNLADLAVRRDIMRKIQSGEIDADTASANHYHSVMELFAKQFGGQYFRVPAGSETP